MNLYQKDLFPIVKKNNTSKVLLFPGCTYLNSAPHLIPRYLSLLKAVAVHVEVLDDPICCGYIFRSLGDEDNFKKNAYELVRKIKRLSPDVIVNLCPTCNRHFEKHLKRDGGLGETIEIYHVCRFLLRYGIRKHIRLLKGAPRVIVGYQDPCWLGRRSSDYGSARRIIRALGYDLRDGESSRQFAACCGYSGVVPCYHPEVSDVIAGKRMDYFMKMGVECVVTSCPRCNIGLKKAQKGNVHVLDFAELFDMEK